jgi:hypothetical protein
VSKFNREKERLLLDTNADPIDRANALWCMRSDGVIGHEELVVSWLQEPEHSLRAEAHRTLLHWGRAEWVPLSIERATTDPDDRVRRSLCFDFRDAVYDFPEFRTPLLRTLVHAVEHDAVEAVAETAYRSLRYILLELRDIEQSNPSFDRARDVDWALLAPYR